MFKTGKPREQIRRPVAGHVCGLAGGVCVLAGRACILSGLGLLLLASSAGAQVPPELTSTQVPPGVGWPGFTDLGFLLGAFLNLVLAAALGAVIGALIGILVMKYGLVVGFVLFGIGGLIRFRTVMRSAQLTGQVIFVTLIGLTCGLDLPHVAVLATVFEFILTFFLEARITYRVDVRGLPLDRFSEAVDAYRAVLAGRRFRVLSETKWPDKGRICFIFRSTGRDTRDHIEQLLDEKVDASLRGSMDWEVD